MNCYSLSLTDYLISMKAKIFFMLRSHKEAYGTDCLLQKKNNLNICVCVCYGPDDGGSKHP
jgi:hypothetical protein